MASASAQGGLQKVGGATNLIIRAVSNEDRWFQLNEMHVRVDDRPVFDTTDAASLQRAERFIPAPAAAAGPHRVSVMFILHGRGSGIYEYLAGYRFKVVSQQTFKVVPAKTTCISVLQYFKRNVPMQDMPAVDFREEQTP